MSGITLHFVQRKLKVVTNLSENSATASLSASGSLAKMWMALPFTPCLMSSAFSELYLSTVAMDRFRADFPSSGLGNGTVGNVGSGSRN